MTAAQSGLVDSAVDEPPCFWKNPLRSTMIGVRTLLMWRRSLWPLVDEVRAGADDGRGSMFAE